MNATIDLLIQELNEIANKPSAESLRISTMFNVREVFRRIGIESIGYEVEEQVEVINNLYKIPDRIIQVDDVGLERGQYAGVQVRSGAKFDGKLVFTKDVRGLFFPAMKSGKIWIRAYQFQLDESGQPIIPEEAYTACYDYCRAKIIADLPTSPHWQDRRIAKFDAEVSIKTARGHFNEITNSSLRESRR